MTLAQLLEKAALMLASGHEIGRVPTDEALFLILNNIEAELQRRGAMG